MAVGAVFISLSLGMFGSFYMCATTGLGMVEGVAFYTIVGFGAMLTLTTALAFSDNPS